MLAWYKYRRYKRPYKNILVSLARAKLQTRTSGGIVDVTIKGSRQDMQLIVYNMLGEVMGTAMVNGFVELDVAGFPNGVYQLAFTNLAGEKYTTRIVVNK